MKKHFALLTLAFLWIACTPSGSDFELHTKQLHLEVKLAQGHSLDDKVFAELVGDDSVQSKSLDLEVKDDAPDTLVGSCSFLIGESTRRALILNHDNHKSQLFLLPIPPLPAVQGLSGWMLPNDVIDPGFAFWNTMHDATVEKYQLPIEQKHAVRFRVEDWENKYR